MADIVFGDSQVTGRKTNEQIADEVEKGLWGTGDDRKKRLSDAGYDYGAVQGIVNSRYAAQQQAPVVFAASPVQEPSVSVPQSATVSPVQQNVSGAQMQQTEPAPEQDAAQISSDFWKGVSERSRTRTEERLANRQLYGISMPDEDYAQWNEVISNAENPPEEAHRIGSAYQWSRILNAPLADCYMNLDALNAEWFGDKVTDYKTGFKAISDMITLGNNNVKIGILGNQIRAARMSGNTELEEAYWNQYRALQAVNEDLQDNIPRGWAVEALKAGAQSLPFAGAMALAGLFGNFIYPGAGGTVASFMASSYLTAGQEYIDLIENGSDPTTANLVSVLSGGLQGFVEVSLGNVASALAGSARIAGKTAATLTGNVAKNVANKLGKVLHFGPLAKVVTNMGLRYAGNIAEEGAEEVVQYFISLAGQELAAALDGYDLPDDDIKTVVTTAMEEFKGGVMGAVVLGVASDSFNAAADISEYKRVGKLAGMVDSKEFFRNAVKDSPIFEGMSDQKKNSVIDEIHGAAQSKRDAATAQQVNEIKEVNRAAEGFEDIQVDEETGASNARPVYRTDAGTLYIEDDTLRDTDSGEVRRYKAGDPDGDLDKNLYGYIDYEVDEQNKQVYIRDFIMNAARENLRQELYDDFARESAGYEIIWEPDGSRAKAIKESLVRNNPQGVKAGLTYYDDIQDVMDSEKDAAARRKVAEAVAKYMPNVRRQGHLAAAVSLLEQMARSQDKSLSVYLDETFGSDIFGNTADVEAEANQENMTFELSQDEAKEKGYQVAAGATKWKDYENDLRAVIYAGQSADFSTWAHELAHIYRKQLSGDRLAEVEKAFGVVKGDWIHSAIRDVNGNLMSSEEAFAYGFQDWLKTGNAPTAEMKNVFQKFAEFLARCFNALKKHIDLNPEIENVYKQMLSGGDSVLAQAERAVAEADRKMRADALEQRKEQARKAEAAKNQETRTETEQETSRQADMAESAGINPDELNLTPEDKVWLERMDNMQRKLSELAEKLRKESRADEDNEFPLDRKEAREIASEQVASDERMHDIVQDVKDAAGNGSFAHEQQTILNDNDTTQDMVNDVITDTAGKSFDVRNYRMDINDIPADMFSQTAEDAAEVRGAGAAVGKENYFKNTYAQWAEVDESKLPGTEPDYKSASGSEYWYTDKGVYRRSNHWGKVSSCSWYLDDKVFNARDGNKIGYADFSSFRKMEYGSRRDMLLADAKKYIYPQGEEAVKEWIDNSIKQEEDALKRAKDNGNDFLVPAYQEALDIYKSLSVEDVKNFTVPEWDSDAERGRSLYQKNDAASTDGILYQTVYHGSAYDFGRFSTEHVNEGEGSQSFGWGLYFSGSEDIARDYAERQYKQKYNPEDRIARLRMIESNIADDEKKLQDYATPEAYAALKQKTVDMYEDLKKSGKMTVFEKNMLEKNIASYTEEDRLSKYNSIKKEIANEQKEADALKKEIDSINAVKDTGKRNLYTVEIPDRTYLVWDKTVPKATRGRIMEALYKKLIQGDYKGAERELREELVPVFDTPLSGKEIYDDIWTYLGSDKDASMFLADMGIVGINYPAGTNFGGKNTENVRNYVLFDDSKASIKDHLLFQIAGEIGAQNLDNNEEVAEGVSRMQNLAVAKQMETDGKDAQSIRLATGWERGADGKWRYEIGDDYHLKNIKATNENLERYENQLKEAERDLKNLVENKDKAERKINDMVKRGVLPEETSYETELAKAQEEVYIAQMLLKYDTGLDVRKALLRLIDRGIDPVDFWNDMGESFYLPQLIDNPELFKAYPALEKTTIAFARKDVDNHQGSYDPNEESITIYPSGANNYYDFLSVLAHEVQHAIQRIEGFAVGGSAAQFETRDFSKDIIENLTKQAHELFNKQDENWKKLVRKYNEASIRQDYETTSRISDELENDAAFNEYVDLMSRAVSVQEGTTSVSYVKTPEEQYRSLAGEVEARNVQARRRFTPEERRNILLAATEDVSRADQIILFQTAYHGSGAEFDKFDTENYGLSGEGSMSFGYGTYVTDNEDIAREYAERQRKRTLSKDSVNPYDGNTIEHEMFEDLRSDSFNFSKTLYKKYLEAQAENIKKDPDNPYQDFKANEKLAVIDNLVLGEENNKTNLYTVEIPDDGYLQWDKKYSPDEMKGFRTALYYEMLENAAFEGSSIRTDKGLVSYTKEETVQQLVDGIFGDNEILTGEDLYYRIAESAGKLNPAWSGDNDEKAASRMLHSIGFAGIKYPAGTIYGNGNGNGAYNYVIFNDDDVRIIDHLLFQTQQELYDDASLYDTWQDFMEAYESGFDPYAMEADDYHSQVPAGADAQWYKTTWELAHGLKPEESLDAEAVLDKYKTEGGDATAKDVYFLEKMKKPGELENFLKRVQQILDTDLSGEEWRGITAEDAAARSEIDEMQKFIRTQLKHGTWLSNAMRVADGKELTPRTRKTMLSLISHSLRDYRAIYSQIMGDEYLAVPEDDTVSGQLRRNVLADPDEDFEQMSPERRRQIAEDISNEDVARRIKSGELRLDGELDGYIKSIKKDLRETEKKYTDLKNEVDEDFRRIADAEQRELLRLHDKLLEMKARWHNKSDTTGRRIERALKTTGRYELHSQTLRADYDRIFRQYSDLKNVTRITAQVSEAMRHQKELYSLREALRQKQQDSRALENLKKLRTQLVKRTMRRVPFDRIDYDSARLLIAIQRVFEPNLMGGVNEWIGQGAADARQVASAWLTDVDERERIEKFLTRKHGELASEMLEKLRALNSIEDFNKWESKDKKRLSKVMPKEDWVRELRLQELSKEREQSIDLDINVDEVTRTVRNPSTGKNEEETRWVIRMPDELANEIKDAVGADLYDDLMHRPFREWTTEDLEKLAARVNDIYKDGRDTLAARKQLRNEEAREIRKRIEALARDSGIQFDDGDTPEERAKKQDKIHKILGLDSDIKGTAAVKKETRLNRLLNGYADANVRRVARILDNYTDGINMQMLYWREDECWNAREAAKERRAKAIKKVMADNKLTEVELSRIVEVDGLKFSVDDLLYVYAADKDYEVVRDDKGNPITDEDGNEQNDDYAPTSRNAVMFGNMLSADEDVARKQEWEEMDRELAEAIAGETLDAEQMQELTAGILNRHPGQTLFMEKCRDRYNRVLAAATELIENNAGLKALYETVAEDYAAEFERMNRVSVEEFNQPVNRVRNYVPMVRLESNGETNANQVKQDLLTTSGGNAAGKIGVNKGMTVRRVAISPLHQKPVQMGLYKTWLASVDRTEHFIAYAPYVRELNRVYKGRDADYTRRFIENRYGRGMLSYIDDYINEVANPNANKVRTAGDDLMRTLRGKTAPAYLAWKLSGILKQWTTSPAPYFQFVSPLEYASAAWQCVTNHGWDLIKKKSLFMRNRVQDPLYDLVDELAEKADTPLKQKLMKLEKKGMSGLEFIDWACVAPGWLACYKKEYARLAQENEGAYDRKKSELVAEQRNITPESPDAVLTAEQIDKAAQDAVLTEADIEAAAVRYADDCTRQCQPSSRLSDLAPLYKNSSEFAKAYLQFQTSLNVIWQNIRYDLPAAVRTKQFKRAAGMVAGYAVAGIAMNMLMEGVTAGSGWKDDDDEKRLNALRNLIFYSTTQFTDSVPLIGSYLTTVAQKALTGRSTYLSTGTDMTPMITKLGSAVMNVSSGNWTKAAGQFGEGVGLALGLPTSGIKEIYKFFTDEDGNFDVGLSTIYGLAKDITGGKGSSKK